MTMQRTLFALCTTVIALAACGDPSPKVDVEPAVPGPFVELPAAETTPAEARPDLSPPAPEPSGPYFEVPKAGEELPTSMTTPGPIPTAFRHVWAIDRKDCTTLPGPTRIAVAPGAIRFYEGRAVVITANTSLEGTAALEVEHTAEGMSNREAHTLMLNPAKTQLTYDRNGESFTYVRCD